MKLIKFLKEHPIYIFAILTIAFLYYRIIQGWQDVLISPIGVQVILMIVAIGYPLGMFIAAIGDWRKSK